MDNQFTQQSPQFVLPTQQQQQQQSDEGDQGQLNSLQNNDTSLEIKVPNDAQFSFGAPPPTTPTASSQPINPVPIHPTPTNSFTTPSNVTFALPTETTQFNSSQTFVQPKEPQSVTFYNPQQQNVTFRIPSPTTVPLQQQPPQQQSSSQVTFALPPSSKSPGFQTPPPPSTTTTSQFQTPPQTFSFAPQPQIQHKFQLNLTPQQQQMMFTNPGYSGIQNNSFVSPRQMVASPPLQPPQYTSSMPPMQIQMKPQQQQQQQQHSQFGQGHSVTFSMNVPTHTTSLPPQQQFTKMQLPPAASSQNSVNVSPTSPQNSNLATPSSTVNFQLPPTNKIQSPTMKMQSPPLNNLPPPPTSFQIQMKTNSQFQKKQQQQPASLPQQHISSPPPNSSMTPINMKTMPPSPKQKYSATVSPAGPPSPSGQLTPKTTIPSPQQNPEMNSPTSQGTVSPQPPVSISLYGTNGGSSNDGTSGKIASPTGTQPVCPQPHFMPPPLPLSEQEKMMNDLHSKKNVVGIQKSQPQNMQREVVRTSTLATTQFNQSAQPVVVTTKKTKENRPLIPVKKVAQITHKMTIKTAIKPKVAPRSAAAAAAAGGNPMLLHHPSMLITNHDQNDDIDESPDDIDINGYDDSDDEDDDVDIVGGVKKPSNNNKEGIHSLLRTYSQRHFPVRKGGSVMSSIGSLLNSKKVPLQRSSFAINAPAQPQIEEDDEKDESNTDTAVDSQTNIDDDEENQKHEREINSLNSKIYKLEKIIEDDHKKIEALIAEKEAEKKHMLEDSLMQVNSIFSAIPIRSSFLESGRFVLFTSLVIDDESVFEKLASESVTASQPIGSQPSGMQQAGQKKLTSKLFSSVTIQQQQQQIQQQHQSAMNLQLNFLKRSYVVKNKNEEGMFYIKGHVGFKMGFDKEASSTLSNGEVHVVAWIQRANYSSIEKIPSNNIVITKNGFQFSIEHNDPRMMDGSIINWIAYTVPRANQDLMATMDAIMNPQRFGKGEAGQAELHAVVKRFLLKYHVDERDATGRTLMHISATFGNLPIIKYLLKKGADINAIDNSGWTALLCAINSGNFEAALALLEFGAYPNATSESGNNALHYLLRATEVNDLYVKVIMMLFERGCNVNVENNDKNTPLHIAAQRCTNTDVLKMLFTLSKPSINAFNKDGYSPIHIAIERNAVNIVNVLIENGADLTAASPDLGTPLDFAHSLKNDAIAEIISNAIARGTNTTPSSSSSSSSSSPTLSSPTITNVASERDINVPGMVCLEVVAAENIVGATDPYCIIDIGEKSFRTDAASKTDSPVWNKTFRVNVEGESVIKATVLNFNLVKSTKPLGFASVPIDQKNLRPGVITDEWYDILALSNAKVGTIHIIIRVPEARTTNTNVSSPVPPAAAAATVAATGQQSQPQEQNTIITMAAAEQRKLSLPLAGTRAPRPRQMMQYSFNMSGKIYDRVFEYEPGFSTMPPAFWEDWTAAASSTNLAPYAFKEGTAAEGRYIECSWDCITHKAGGMCPVFDRGAATYKFLKYINPYEHYNFFTLVDDTPIVFCAARNQEHGTIRLIMLTPRDDFCLILPGPASSSAQWKQPQYSSAIRNAIPFVKNQKLYRFKDDEIAEKLIQDFMRLFTHNRCKFGLVYCAPGQDNERSFLANEVGSPDFDEFCEFIGEKIALQGFQGYAGGLSKTSNLSGEHTIYTRYGSEEEEQEVEVVFHVSTMLPNNPNDPQKIEKKRHIGNDFIVLLFKESNDETDTVDVSTFLSKFNHIFIVVNPIKEDGMPTRYRVTIAANDDIRPFPPFIPKETGNIFEKNDEFREWLLMKLINAERSALNIPLVRGGNMNSRADKLVAIVAKSSKKKAK